MATMAPSGIRREHRIHRTIVFIVRVGRRPVQIGMNAN
jgi:hypothetical protein